MRIPFCTWPLLLFAVSGCGSGLDCVTRGDNVEGHILMTDRAPVETGKTLVLQVSTDSFTSVTGSKSITNTQGLVSVPFSYCGPIATGFSIRAFQDSDGDGTYDVGEGAGRDDSTSDGHGTYRVLNFPTPNAAANPPVEWKVERGIELHLDSGSSQ